jgi:F-box protein 11
VLHKSLELVGDGPAEEIVWQGADSDCLVVYGEQVIVRGLTFQCVCGTKNLRYAVDAAAGHVLLEDCRLSSNSSAVVGVHGKTGLRATLRRCTVHESDPKGGVVVFENAEALLEDCDVHNTRLAALTVGTGARAVCRHCKFHDGKAIGVFVAMGAEITLEKCEIYGQADVAVSLHRVRKARLTGCTIRGCKVGGLLIAASEVLVEDCELEGNNLQVQIGEASAPTLRQCRIHDGATAGIVWTTGAAGRAEDCQVWGHERGEVRIEQGSDPVLLRCTISRGKGSGVSVGQNGKGRLEECDIHGHKTFGVELTGAGHPVLTRTKVRDGQLDGVKVSNKGKVTLDRCDVFGNVHVGLVVGADGEATVRGGSVTKNGSAGVFVDARGSADVEGCDLRANQGAWAIQPGGKVTRKNNRED